MKITFSRWICFCIILVLATFSFAGCKQEQGVTVTDVTPTVTSEKDMPIVIEVDENDPFAVSADENGTEIVILTPGKDGGVTMNVADKTTLGQFLKVVVAKEGYEIRILDADGNSVTDEAIVLVNGMRFLVLNAATGEEAVAYNIVILSQKEIEKTVVKAEKQKQSAKTNKTSSAAPVSSSKSSDSKVKPKETIVLGSIWSDRYSANNGEGKAWKTAFSNVVRKYNISTEVINLNGAEAADIVVKEVMAGKSSADVWEASAYITRNIARKGASCNLFKSKTLDKSKFKSAANDSMTFNGKCYALAIQANSTRPMGIIYNKDLIRKYAKDYDLAKLYENKKWDFDTFRAVATACTQDLNGDAKPDVYGVSSNTNIIGMALTANAGGTATWKNGKVYATMCSDEGINALQFMKSLWGKCWLFRADIKECVADFSAGKSAMFASWLSYYNDIAQKADFPFGFVLMPIGPDQKDYINGQYDARFYLVPKTREKRLDVIGNWLNGVQSASGKLINNEIKNMARNGLDSTAQSIYKWAVNHANAEYSSGLFSSDISTKVDSSVTSRTKDPAKVMTAIRSAAQKELDDYYSVLY